MEDWLEQVRRAAPTRSNQPSIIEARRALRREFRRCSPLVKQLLSDMASIYWPTTPRRHLRMSWIPLDDGTLNPLVLFWNRIRYHHGWQILNVQEDECFVVFLARTSKGFCYELPNDLRTADTSVEQLQEALGKAALAGAIAWDEHSKYHLT
jgi:hypothetical protein